jgi:CIC family chloride channel protein
MLPIRVGDPSRHVAMRSREIGLYALGGLVGGIAGGVFVVAVTSLLKAMLDFFGRQAPWLLVVVPLIGLSLSALVLHGWAGSEGTRAKSPWLTFPPNSVRADITGDVVGNAGREERFPWRLAPIRLLAIFATVGLGAGMGTEAPAAYLGIATGACVGDRERFRRFVRPLAVGGGAAGVSALMGIPLVGTAYVLELGRRNGAPYSPERVIAAVVGGLVGGAINTNRQLNLIRLVVPEEPPQSFGHAVITALFIGALSGAITSLAASAIERAKKWQAAPLTRLVRGGLIMAAAALAIAILAEPRAGFGPGGGAIDWAEAHDDARPSTLVLVALLRATITTAAAAAGGCGGVFVPFLAIGDIAGRVFAPLFEVGSNLAGAAGAAGGIAGGYRLPLTAIAVVLGVGGPRTAVLTCLAVVGVAYLADKVTPFHAKPPGRS